MRTKSQRGIALVITLIMLSIITFLAVAFLSTTRRNKASVAVSLSQTDSRTAAEAGLERAKAEIVSRMMARTNMLVYDLITSRNFINENGFDPSITTTNYLNVNFDYKNLPPGPARTNFTEAERILNIANLFYDPRVPVFVRTNRNAPASFRYFLDFDRNGEFGAAGFFNVTNDQRQAVLTNGTPVAEQFVGDPHWVGVLEDPTRPHSAENRFTVRYSYLVAPVGRTLDINYLHNQSKRIASNRDGFLRNQGAASWEMNLAGFLTDLNTNIWPGPPSTQQNPRFAPYDYSTNSAVPSTGRAFVNALDLLGFRYDGDYQNLRSLQTIYGTQTGARFQNDRTDIYSDGPLASGPGTLTPTTANGPDDDSSRPWSGSINPKRFADVQELFDPNKTSPDFVNAVTGASSTNIDSYNRSTSYRLISQLGVDSGAELRGKININYTNDIGSDLVNTNFSDWNASQFFALTANKLVMGYTNFGITNIQVWPTNQYTPGIHRMLQMAANVYDATTNRLSRPGIGGRQLPFPSVFRPVFDRRNVGQGEQGVFIVGYVEETNSAFLDQPWRSLGEVADRNALTGQTAHNVFGVPSVVGAKKGLPNFNEYTFQTAFNITRKLQFRRTPQGALITNQLYLLTLSNRFGLEMWNSYTSNVPIDVEIRFLNRVALKLTNNTSPGARMWPLGANDLIINAATNLVIPANQWLSYRSPNDPKNFIGFSRDVPFLKTARYNKNNTFSTDNLSFEVNTGFRPPDFTMVITNRLMAAIVDRTGNRVLDLVSLADLDTSFNPFERLTRNDFVLPGIGGVENLIAAVWRTNRAGNFLTPSEGILKQIQISANPDSISDAQWRAYNSQVGDKSLSGRIFAANLATNSAQEFYAPYDPSIYMVQTRVWQANDPLVHYTVGDLIDPRLTNILQVVTPANAASSPWTNQYSTIGSINLRYSPWGGSQVRNSDLGDPVGAFNLAFKDPGVSQSDRWEFPTNKFPSLGYLGRVHRGTPWQTVYMKGEVGSPQDWTNGWVLESRSHPTNDWRLFDHFTTAINENAARGTLSINQPGLAAWSAVLSGVLVLSNDLNSASPGMTPRFAAFPIEPNSAALKNMVENINSHRELKPNKVFNSLGDVLAATALSSSSPFLNRNSDQHQFALTDAAYERIPQQVMSLLRLGEPRFVIYSYGQSLKPADKSLILSGPYRNMCTNYQITGEVATRTVLRVEGTPTAPRAIVEKFDIIYED